MVWLRMREINNNNGKHRRLSVIIIYVLCQLFIFGSNYEYLFDMKGSWKYISIIGFILSTAGGILLFGIFKKNEKKERILRELQEAEHSESLVRLRSRSLQLLKEQMGEMQAEMKVILEHVEMELKRKKQGDDIGETVENEGTVYKKRCAYCSNLIVQAVLEEKQAECKRNGFSMNIDTRIGEIPAIAKIHLCSVFTNLIDNAIAASLSMAEKERQITVKAAVKAEYLIVEVLNRTPAFHAGKRPDPGHGYGKQILSDIAQTYDGYYEAGLEGEFYKATVILRIGGRM